MDKCLDKAAYTFRSHHMLKCFRFLPNILRQTAKTAPKPSKKDCYAARDTWRNRDFTGKQHIAQGFVSSRASPLLPNDVLTARRREAHGHGEHWHIAFHLPPRYAQDLAAQVAIWTGEAVGDNDGKAKCLARSVSGAWYINRRNENAGEYLGKATPRTRSRYGKRVSNDLRQTRRHGGEGIIEGKRFGISRHIGKTAQRRRNWK